MRVLPCSSSGFEDVAQAPAPLGKRHPNGGTQVSSAVAPEPQLVLILVPGVLDYGPGISDSEASPRLGNEQDNIARRPVLECDGASIRRDGVRPDQTELLIAIVEVAE